MATHAHTAHILVIDTDDYGTSVYVYASRAAAEARLLAWVDEWWDHEGIEGDKPEDPEARIAAYFEQVDDETYSLHEEEVIFGV